MYSPAQIDDPDASVQRDLAKSLRAIEPPLNGHSLACDHLERRHQNNDVASYGRDRWRRFVGSHLCRRLLSEGYEVICLDNLLTGSLDNVEHLDMLPGFRFAHADVTEALPVTDPVDLVVHLACPHLHGTTRRTRSRLSVSALSAPTRPCGLRTIMAPGSCWLQRRRSMATRWPIPSMNPIGAM